MIKSLNRENKIFDFDTNLKIWKFNKKNIFILFLEMLIVTFISLGNSSLPL